MSVETSTVTYGWRSLAALGAALAILLGLGTWQLQRKNWKEALLAEIAARGSAASREILPAADAAAEYTRVRLRGSFIADSERYIFISVPRQASGVGGPGYWQFQLFETEGRSLYVNRGFVPEADKLKRRDAPRDVVIEGVFRLPEPRGRHSNPNDPTKNVYYVRAPLEFAASAKASAIARLDSYIDMTGPMPTSGLPLPMVGKITIPNRHLEYALTWYALAATLIGVAIAVARRRG
jgi:surfeit locus 1 family protein